MEESLVDIDVNIPEDLLKKFDIYVVKPSYPGDRSEAIRNLILAEVLKRQGKDKFFKKRHFNIPKNCFILFALPSHEWQKLEEWNKRKETPQIALAPNGEVFLINEAGLAKWNAKKVQRIRILVDVHEKLKLRAEEKNMDVTDYVSSLVPG
jgi:hypothetical protein